jgi:hypothetical protein
MRSIPVVGSSGFMSVDLGFRGATVGLSLLIAGVLPRDRYASTLARLSAALAVGAAAAAIWSAPAFSARWEWWSLFFLALSSGTAVVFWLWARAAFDDDFVLRRWHGALWVVIVGLQLLVVGGSGGGPFLDWRSAERCRSHILVWPYWRRRRRLQRGARISWKDGGGCE